MIVKFEQNRMVETFLEDVFVPETVVYAPVNG